jgi:hypothetical protein
VENYTFTVILYDSGLPYPNKEDALHDCREWAEGIAATENCQIATIEVKVDE